MHQGVFKSFAVCSIFLASAAAAAAFVAPSDALAGFKRASAMACHSDSFYSTNQGALQVPKPSGSRVFSDVVSCGFPDDSAMNHNAVTTLNVHGRGAGSFFACTKRWNGSATDCSNEKTTSGTGRFSVSFNSSDLSRSWTSSGAVSDFAYVFIAMDEGSEGQVWGWFASN
jgi:hypothetical protein